MERSAILFGSPESVHMQRFIRLLLNRENGFNEIVVFNISRNDKMTENDIEFYKSLNIEIICLEPREYPNRIIRATLNYLRRKRYLKHYLRKHKKFDYCFIQYCAWQNVMWVNATKKYYRSIIPVFWGGDVLRNKILNSKIYRRFLEDSSHIILPNENSYEVFNSKTNGVYKNKAYTIQFPSSVCEKMLEYRDIVNVSEGRKQFGFPLDKKIVICGHTATRAEQYEAIIEQLEKCNPKTINACCFVFFMTYAPDDYRAYQAEIEDRLSKTKLNYIILKDFLQQDAMIQLHYASDVHITMIRTDAFSCFLQEQMMAENVVIYGKWLNYFEIENDDFFSCAVENFGCLAEVVDDIIHNFDFYSLLTKRNPENLVKLISNDSIQKAWMEKVFN